MNTPKSLNESTEDLLRDVEIINLEQIEKGTDKYTDFIGIKKALALLKETPDKKIILTSFLPIERFISSKYEFEEVKMLLQKKNVKFLRLPYSSDKLNECIKTFDSENTIVDALNWETAFRKLLSGKIMRFFHSFRYTDPICRELDNAEWYLWCMKYFSYPQEKKPQVLIDFEDDLISLLQLQHKSFKKLPKERNLKAIVDYFMFERKQLLPEWTRFEGVFVDWDETLFDNTTNTFKKETLDLINDYQNQWKKITLRTFGNIEEKKKVLEAAWYNFELRDKSDFKWWIVEIAVDDESSEKFFANTLVKPEKFIQIKR